MDNEEFDQHMRHVAGERFKKLAMMGEEANGISVNVEVPTARNDNKLSKIGFENEMVMESINRMLMQEFSANLGVDELDLKIDTAMKLIDKKILLSMKQVSDMIINFEERLENKIEKLNKKFNN